MKIILVLFVVLFFSGCLYFGDKGVSTRLYNDCKEYYDANGDYVKECPKNLVEYDELGEGWN